MLASWLAGRPGAGRREAWERASGGGGRGAELTRRRKEQLVVAQDDVGWIDASDVRRRGFQSWVESVRVRRRRGTGAGVESVLSLVRAAWIFPWSGQWEVPRGRRECAKRRRGREGGARAIRTGASGRERLLKQREGRRRRVQVVGETSEGASGDGHGLAPSCREGIGYSQLVRKRTGRPLRRTSLRLRLTLQRGCNWDNRSGQDARLVCWLLVLLARCKMQDAGCNMCMQRPRAERGGAHAPM